MDAVGLFLLEHARVHAPAVSEPGTSEEDVLLRGLTGEQIRARPHGMNSLAWLLWHMARCEDVATNLMIAGGQQLLDAEDWPARMRVPRRDIGTGMTDPEVDTLSREVDLAALRAYRNAVGRRTRGVARALRPAELEEVVGEPTRLRRCAEEGVFGPNAGWVKEFWEGWTKGWFLVWLGAGHNYMHRGEAVIVRGFLGLRGR